MLNKILERVGLSNSDLSDAEEKTLLTWLEAVKKKVITVEDIKSHLAGMRYSVEQELVKTSHNSKQDIFLKARLRNYMLLEAFLSSPKKAEEQLNQALAGFVSRIK